MNARELARTLGVSEATVSRLASGHRQPSLELMVKIRTVLKWKLDPQADALRDGKYGEILAAKMAKAKTPQGATSGQDRVHGRTELRKADGAAAVESAV